MTNFPTIMDTVEMLNMHKKKQSYSNAQLAANLNLFGWNGQWTTAHVASLLIGQAKATEKELEFFKLYLMRRFYDYNAT